MNPLTNRLHDHIKARAFSELPIGILIYASRRWFQLLKRRAVNRLVDLEISLTQLKTNSLWQLLSFPERPLSPLDRTYTVTT